MALVNKTESFRAAMKDNNINADTMNTILHSVANCDDLVSNTFDLFKSAKCTEKYMTKNFSYVSPVRVSLGSGEFQYVPVIETLKNIVGDRSFQKLRKDFTARSSVEADSLDLCLSDLEDGARLRNSDYFRLNPDALRLPYL